MASVKKSHNIIFLLALLILTGVSSAFDIASNASIASTATAAVVTSTEIKSNAARETSTTAPQRIENYILVNKQIRQSCDSFENSDLVECNIYFNAKKHSLSNDPSECLVFGYFNYTLASSKCLMRVPANPCLQSNDFSWMSRCMKVYYAGTAYTRIPKTFSLNKTQVFESDNIKIGSFRIPSADFVNPAVFFKETYGITEVGRFII